MQPDQQQRIMGYFIEEARDHLNTIEQGLLNLQSTIADSEMVNEVFRAAHSIKGGAAMLGIHSIQRTSHSLEDYFKILKESPVKVDQKLENLFLQVFDALRELLEQLQGPFGLTDDTAGQIMGGVEPVFGQLDQHLKALVGKGEAIPTAQTQAAVATSNPFENNALVLVFQNDVPTRLREMLQLFKQPESQPGCREQLQGLCQRLAELGEQFQLSQWCELLEIADRAIGNPDNPYRTLAPIVIKDIKQAQELVLAGRAWEISPCNQLQELAPPSIVVEESLEEALFGAMEDPALLDLEPDADLDLPFTEEVFAGWEQDMPVAEVSFPNGAGVDLGLDQSGPEMGMAELNSLADLFEGEVPDLGSTWEEEEVIRDLPPTTHSSNQGFSAAESSADDFADLLFEESRDSSQVSVDGDDLIDLFGENLLDEGSVHLSSDSIDASLLQFEDTSHSDMMQVEDLGGVDSSMESDLFLESDASIPSSSRQDDLSSLGFMEEGSAGLDAPSDNLDNLGQLFEEGEEDSFAADGDDLFLDLDSAISEPTFPEESILDQSGIADPWGGEEPALPETPPITEEDRSTSDLVDFFSEDAVASPSEPLTELLEEDSLDYSNLFGFDASIVAEDNAANLEELVDDTSDEFLFQAFGSTTSDPTDDLLEELAPDPIVEELIPSDDPFSLEGSAEPPEAVASSTSSKGIPDPWSDQLEEFTINDNLWNEALQDDLGDESLEDAARFLLEDTPATPPVPSDVTVPIDAIDELDGGLEFTEASVDSPFSLDSQDNVGLDALFASTADETIADPFSTEELAEPLVLDTSELEDLENLGFDSSLTATEDLLEDTSHEGLVNLDEALSEENTPDLILHQDSDLDALLADTTDDGFDLPAAEPSTDLDLDAGDLFAFDNQDSDLDALLADTTDGFDLPAAEPSTDLDLDAGDLFASDSQDSDLDALLADATDNELGFSAAEPSADLDLDAGDLFAFNNQDSDLDALLADTTDGFDLSAVEPSADLDLDAGDLFASDSQDSDLDALLADTTDGFDLSAVEPSADLDLDTGDLFASDSQDSDLDALLANTTDDGFDLSAAEPSTDLDLDAGDLFALDDLQAFSGEATSASNEGSLDMGNGLDALFGEEDGFLGSESIPTPLATTGNELDQETTDLFTFEEESPANGTSSNDWLSENLTGQSADASFAADASLAGLESLLEESPHEEFSDSFDNLFDESEPIPSEPGLTHTNADLDDLDLFLSGQSAEPTDAPEAHSSLSEDALFDSFTSDEATESPVSGLDDLNAFLSREIDLPGEIGFDLPEDDFFEETSASEPSDPAEEMDDLDALLNSVELSETSGFDNGAIDGFFDLDGTDATGIMSQSLDLPEAPLDFDLGDLGTSHQVGSLNLDEELLNLPETESPSLTRDDPFSELDDLLTGDDLPGNVAKASADTSMDFDDLEALLSESAPAGSAASTPPPANAASPTNLEDFADLEALLSEESPAASTPVAPAPPPISADSSGDNFDDLDELLKDANEKLGGAPAVKTTRGPISRINTRKARPGTMEQLMRVPVKHLDNLSNLVGELVVNRNSLEQDQERLRQSLDNLLYQVQQLSDVGQRMQDLYERSLLESSLLASRQGHRSAFSIRDDHSQGSSSTGVEYDPLEMDRFTGFHSLSQEMIELIVRVRESASDIEFIVDETDQVTRMFRQVTTQLQEGLTRSRMVPFAQMADRLPRNVRDNALKYKKQASLRVEGRDTLIDKMILDKLTAPGGPLDHLINNAIAHGIESPEVRQTSGKAPSGLITVSAFHQGNQTVISVADDGAGIDTERVKRKAVEKRLITIEEARNLSRLDVYELLFHPGFSTKDQADDLAGRGVGMDVVLNTLSEIRGTISTDSALGKGTTFTIRLPLTLSISKALCCISDRARIAFPMDGVEDMLDIPRERIQTNSEGQPCISWRETLLPLRPLTELLSYNRHLSRGSVYGGNQEEDIISVVVLRSAGNFLALQVDQVLGEQEIVIKQLEGPVPKPVGVAGATVLGDGRIMPIADVLELIDLSVGRIRRDVSGSLWDQSGGQVVQETPPSKSEPTVLIVDDSITVRELLSMTFNKVGYRVEQARDGQEAWEKLRSGLPCDIVFCDIEMPRMDGLELLSRIQKDSSLNHLPIAMLTSRGADRHRQMAASLGASGYFTKPYLEEALLDAAQRMLKGEVLLNNSGA